MTSSPSRKRQLRGTVVSTAMSKTASVRIDRRVTHSKYGKMYTISRKFLVHDPQSHAKTGDVIVFEECRPLSKQKRWRYLRTVVRAEA